MFEGKFLGKILGRNVKAGVDKFTDLMVAFNPEAATDAQIDVFRDQIEEFSEQYIMSLNKTKKEESDVTTLQVAIDKNLKALGVLKDRSATLQGAELAKVTEQARELGRQIDEQEDQMKYEAEEAQMAATEAAAYKEALDTATAKFEQSMRLRNRVVHDLKMAGIAKERAAARLEQAKKLDELRRAGGKGNDVMDRVSKVAAETRAKAEAQNMAAAKIESTTKVNTAGSLADEILGANAAEPKNDDPFARLR